MCFLRVAMPALSPSSDEETMSVAKPGGGELEAPLEFERQTNGRPTAAFSQFSLNLLPGAGGGERLPSMNFK